MIRAAILGLGISAVAYLIISPLLRLWAPARFASFLFTDVETTALLTIGFILIVNLLVRLKIKRLFRNYGY